MGKIKIRGMPRIQQKAVMSKINPGPGQVRNQGIKPSYNIPKKPMPIKKETKEPVKEHIEEETKEDSDESG